MKYICDHSIGCDCIGCAHINEHDFGEEGIAVVYCDIEVRYEYCDKGFCIFLNVMLNV